MCHLLSSFAFCCRWFHLKKKNKTNEKFPKKLNPKSTLFLPLELPNDSNIGLRHYAVLMTLMEPLESTPETKKQGEKVFVCEIFLFTIVLKPRTSSRFQCTFTHLLIRPRRLRP
jgi:hypothetical protein